MPDRRGVTETDATRGCEPMIAAGSDSASSLPDSNFALTARVGGNRTRSASSSTAPRQPGDGLLEHPPHLSLYLGGRRSEGCARGAAARRRAGARGGAGAGARAGAVEETKVAQVTPAVLPPVASAPKYGAPASLPAGDGAALSIWRPPGKSQPISPSPSAIPSGARSRMGVRLEHHFDERCVESPRARSAESLLLRGAGAGLRRRPARIRRRRSCAPLPASCSSSPASRWAGRRSTASSR